MDKWELKEEVSRITFLGRNAVVVRDEILASIDKLDEPTHEPVEVEPFVADWLDSLQEAEKGKDCLIYELVFAAVEDAEYELDQIEEWIGKNGNIFTLADALRYGYVRKPEKQWVVKINRGYVIGLGARDDSFDFVPGTNLYREHAHKFTNKSKAQAVATLVDGKVEEL